MLCEPARRRVPGRTLRLRYEDSRDDPAGTVRRIAAEFELPLEDVACRLEHGDSFTVGHNVGGNPIRHQDAIRFEFVPTRTGSHCRLGWRRRRPSSAGL